MSSDQPRSAPGSEERSFLQALQERPDDHHQRLVFADWLDEHVDPRGELLRLLHALTQSVAVPHRDRLENRLRSLVASGVPAVGPFFTNSIGMKFAWIPAGTFLMGSPPEEKDRRDDETQHVVTLTRGYYLSVHPVTQKAWRVVMGDVSSFFRGDDNPVDGVSWNGCWEFLRELSEREARGYRLPTEAEWEYACRAGTTTPFHFGKKLTEKEANCSLSKPSRPCAVGSYAPNAFGLCQLHGNVWEWCADWYGTFSDAPAIDPVGVEAGDGRVLRGGSFANSPADCRAAIRLRSAIALRDWSYGFRVALRLD